MKLKITAVLAFLCILTIQAQQKTITAPITLEIGTQYTFQSTLLKEERSLLIHLPEAYQKSETKYPVIYILDGNSHFEHAINAATILQENERMPESIIVAIPNQEGTRGRDLARERDLFKQFIKDEVIDYVEKNYRTTNQKTIFGHSMAGAFVLNFLATEPSLFDNYIAASPVIQIFDSELHIKFQELFKEEKTLNKSLYFTLTGVAAEGKRATEAMNKFVAILKEEAPKSLSWNFDFIENQVHMTTPYLSMYQGFSMVFSDFQAPSFVSYTDYQKQGGITFLKTYYQQRAKKYQTSALIPENTLSRLANVLLDDQQSDMAINLFKENIKNYPDSATAYNSLARGYEDIKEQQKAIEAYQMAISLAEKQSSPNTAYFKRQLDRVQKQVDK